MGGVISFGAGAISFTHVIKATEPVWSALISAVFFREYLKWPVYATLIPIIGGVSLASITEQVLDHLAAASRDLSLLAEGRPPNGGA